MTARQSKADAAQPGLEANHPDAADLAAIFQPVVGARAFTEVVDQITYAIKSGRLRIGQRLPTLDELARLMRVSKPTVGEAVKVLADAQVLRVRRGATGGVEVVSQQVPAETLRLSSQRRARRLGELVEARRAIEFELARLASMRATPAELDEMEDLAATLERVDIASPEWDRANTLFHYAIGRAARSELLAYYQHDVLEEMAIFLGAFPPRYSDPASSIEAHRDTLEALRTRDPELAVQAMRRHLHDLEDVASILDQA